jgi:hypothetical protein
MQNGSQLLYADYDHWGARLDLYGLPGTEDEGCVITDVKRAGTSLNLTYLFSVGSLHEMGFWLDAWTHQEHLVSKREARSERVLHDLAMAGTDHQWRSL